MKRIFGSSAATLAVVVATTLAARAAEPRVLPGHVPRMAARLAPIGQPNATNELRLALSLPLREQAALKTLLDQIYNPTSPNFRHYLSAAEFAERFGPTPNQYAALSSFCQTNGLRVTGTHPNRTVLDVTGPVHAIEAAFHTRLRLYQHPRENRTFFAPDTEPSVAPSLPLLHIAGLQNLDHPRAMAHHAPKSSLARSHDGSGPDGAFLGSDLRAVYAPGVTLTGTGQVLALVEFDGFYANDITKYEQLCHLPAVPVTPVLLDGFSGTPTKGQNSGNTEVALDIQMAMSMAPGLDRIVPYEAAPSATAIDVLNRIATDNAAKEIACAWTWGIYDPGTDQVFQQYAAQGQSFLQASGDGGAYSGGVDAPADQPYATVVGGTTLTTSGSGAWAGEVTWNDNAGDASGGGTSAIYPIPTWQAGVNMNVNQGSTSFRNIPDVAMIADNVISIGDNGTTNPLVGTSIGTPLWAAFIALANQQAAANGQPLVGFINPVVYALGRSGGYLTAFHDIVGGDNSPITEGDGNGFPAVAGYDLSTGWGTPRGLPTINLLLGALNNQVDHFTWGCLNGMVSATGLFAASLSAQTLFDAPASGYNGTANLTAWQTQTNVAFSRDFENSDLSDWTNLGGPYSVSIDGSTAAAGTSRSLTLVGGDGNSSYNGLSHSLPNLSPDVFEFYVRAASASATCGYVVAGSAAYRTNAVFHFRMDSSGQMGLTDGGGNFYGTPFVAAQWYKIDLLLNWSARTVDYYVNGSLVLAGIPFCNPDLTALSVFFLYNFDTGSQAWWDQFSLLKSSATSIALTPSAATFTNGLWSGNLTLAQAGTNVTLSADDGAGHSGTSEAFTPGQLIASGAVQITGQPANQAVSAGSSATFSVVAPGCLLDYQWSKNGAPLADGGRISGAATPTLKISDVLSTDDGSYTVTVSTGSASTNSLPAVLTVLDPAIVRGPTGGLVALGQSNVLSVIAAGTAPLKYQWYYITKGHTHKLAGKTASTLIMRSATKAMSGGYYTVVANQLGAATSAVAQIDVELLKATLVVTNSGGGTLSPNYSGQSLQIGRKYTTTARPDPGYVFAGWDLGRGNTSNVPRISFVMRSNLVLKVSFTPNPFFPLAGTYQGLFYNASNPAPESSGFLSAVLTSKGTFTAKLQTAGKTYPLSGQFLGGDGSYSGSLSRPGGPSLSLSWQLDLSGSNGLTGTLSADSWTAQLLALPASPTVAAKYTLLLPGDGAAAMAPGGDGYATVQVAASGGVRVAGVLADDAKFSQAASISGHGQYPLYASLYSGAGVLFGWLTLTNDPASDIDGTFAWLKSPGGIINPAGIVFTNEVIGSKYTFNAGAPVLNIGTGQFWMANGGLSQNVTNTISLGSDNKVPRQPGDNLTLSFTTSSGLFRGQVTDAAGDTLSFGGVALQKQNYGAGSFQGASQSGRVFIGPSSP